MFTKKDKPVIYYFVPLFFLGLLLLFLGYGLESDPAIIPSPLIGKPVPCFSLPVFSDNTTVFHKKSVTEKIFSDHISLLVVWSSWCENCLLEHQFLLKIKNTPSIKLVAINYRDELAAAQHLLEQYGNPYQTIIYDPEGSLSMNLGVYGVPESFLIDKRGIIRQKFIGPITDSLWEEKIKPIINYYEKEI